MSDKEKRLQSRFWQALRKAFGTKLNFSSSYHTGVVGKLKE